VIKKIFRNKVYLVNFVIIFIAVLFFINISINNKEIKIELKYKNEPIEFINFLKNKFLEKNFNKLSIIYIFNNKPKFNNIEDMNKLFFKFKKKIQFFVLLPHLPYNFKLNNYKIQKSKIICQYNENYFKSNYFVLLKNKKVIYVDDLQDIVDTSFLIKKSLTPEKGYKDYAVSIDRIRSSLLLKLKNGNIKLLNIRDNHFNTIKNFQKFSKTYFIISGCSICKLKFLIKKIKHREILSDENSIIIFPIYSHQLELSQVLNEYQINFPVFIDYYDSFNLLTIITNKDKNIISIEKKDIEEDLL